MSAGFGADAEELIESAEATSAYTRRSTIARAGAAATAAAAATGLLAPRAAQAAASNVYIIVDAGGGGDYTDLETAVKSAPSESTILVKHGLYTINARMYLKSGMRILGEGFGTHIRARDGLNDNIFLIFNDNVVLENLRIDGNGANQSAGSGSCVNFQPTSRRGTVLNCWIHSSPGYNLVGFPGCSELVWVGNHVYDSVQDGIELQGCTDCTVTGNVSSGNLIGIHVWNSTTEARGNSVVGNVARGCRLDGILLQDGAHDNTVIGNTADGNGRYGIFVGNGGSGSINPAHDNVVSGNAVYSNGSSGIRLNGISSCVVSENTVRSNKGHGIHAYWVDSSTLVGNVVRSNNACGIRLEAPDSNPCRGVVVDGNVCRDNGQDSSQPGHGISLAGECTSIIVAHNRCFDGQGTKTQQTGISVQDLAGAPKNSNLLIGPNLLDGNRDRGLDITSDPAKVGAPPFQRKSATVGNTQVAVPHGLPYVPLSVTITMRTKGDMWLSAPSDATNVYLTADGPGRQADLLIG